jgi:hypothetical protein
MPPISELTRSSSLIFTGTVLETRASSVPMLPPSDDLVTVRVDRGLRVDPALGDLRGRTITVAAAKRGTLAPGERAVFFTHSWIHGQGIAVREVEHVDVAEEDSVASTIADLPRIHLQERLQSAALVVLARVASVSSIERVSLDRNDAYWARAQLTIETVFRGSAASATAVYFPTSDHPQWARAPRLRPRQRGIMSLHAPQRDRSPTEAALPNDALVVLDPADVQPVSELNTVQQLLGLEQ